MIFFFFFFVIALWFHVILIKSIINCVVFTLQWYHSFLFFFMCCVCVATSNKTRVLNARWECSSVFLLLLRIYRYLVLYNPIVNCTCDAIWLILTIRSNDSLEWHLLWFFFISFEKVSNKTHATKMLQEKLAKNRKLYW